MIQFLKVFCFLNLILTFPVHAKIMLQKGDWATRSVIDTALRRTNLTFKYKGCDKNPSSNKLKLKSDGICKNIESYKLSSGDNQFIQQGRVGEILAEYDEPAGDCQQVTEKTLVAPFSLVSIYDKFKENGCRPTHVLIRDSMDDNDHSRIWKAQANKSLCKLRMAHIKKDGFPTEIHPSFNLTANDQGFKIGKHTHYRFDHDNKVWCVKFQNGPDKCGHWPAPLPMAYQNTKTGKFHVRATMTLTPDGKASIRGINKVYNNLDEVYAAQKRGDLNNTDASEGRVDYKTWRKPSGLIRAIAKAYETDTPHANHQRSMNFFARNIFGVGITNSWCPEEHCFMAPKTDRLKASACKKDPTVEMSHGGNGNTCHSCIGITPGHCAIEPDEVAVVRSALKQDDAFTIQHTGEYKWGQNVESGLIKNFQNIVSNPKNPGCHKGYAPSYDDIFDPANTGTEVRTINSISESL